MNIEELRQIKNKSIAQQNELMYLEMKRCADNASSIPWLAEMLSQRGYNKDEGILVLLSSIPDKAVTLWYGTWLTTDKKFFEFVVATAREEDRILEIESWQQADPEVLADKEGIGKTPAYIALELLSSMTS